MKEQNTYDIHAKQFIEMIDNDDILGPELVIPKLLEFSSPVGGLRVLDAGCGEGRISRALYDLGADVIGIEVSQNLVDAAMARRGDRSIKYQCTDLSNPPPDYYKNVFDLIVANLVIDDVPDYIGFIGTICQMTKEWTIPVNREACLASGGGQQGPIPAAAKADKR